MGYTYNNHGKINSISLNGQTLLDNASYLPFSTRPKAWTWGNGQVYARHYDKDLRLSDYLLGTDTRTLQYDDINNITDYQYTNTANNRSFVLDFINRLFSYTTNAKNTGQGYRYDDNGNRTTVKVGSSPYTYSTDLASNQLDTVAGPVAKTYTYDNAGNIANDGQTTFNWNAAGHLSSAVTGTPTTKYQYNAFSQRVAKWGDYVDNGPQRFVYDADGHLLGEYNNNNALRQETVYLGNIPVAVVKPGTTAGSIVTYLVQADHLDTPRVILNNANVPVWRWDNSDAFGVGLPDQDPDGDGIAFEYNLRFPGQYYDKETGLHYNHHRYYDPKTGRYISPDPIGLAGGTNPYAYVGNNPLKWIDPTGLDVTITIDNRAYSSTGNSVAGTISVTSDRTSSGLNGYTMENAHAGDNGNKPPIPAGTYDATVRTDHSPNRVELQNVPGYKNIQIHNGSYPRNFKGCFGAGSTQSTDFLGGTVGAMNQINSIIKADGTGNITVNVSPIQSSLK